MSRDFQRGFFEEDSTLEAIERVQSSDQLTIFVGAGVSADQDIPTWSSLMRSTLQQLLVQVSSRREFGFTHVRGREDEFAQEVLDTSNHLLVATMIDQLCLQVSRGDHAAALEKRNGILRELIYKQNGKPRRFNAKPSLARELLELAISLKTFNPGRDLHIVTTNYDDVFREIVRGSPQLRERLQQAEIGLKLYPAQRPTAFSRREIPIVPIHGFIPRRGNVSRPVFSEPDYVWWLHEGPYRDYVAQRLDHGVTLMLGTSLRDFNIISYITRTQYQHGALARFALMPAQGDDALRVLGPERYPDVVRLMDGRPANLGIKLLAPDFFGQVNQFLFETQLSASATFGGRAYVPYMDRLADWWQGFNTSKYVSNVVRESVTSDLQNLALQIHADHIFDVDHIKLEIWVRSDMERLRDPRHYELWANSQSVWKGGSAYWKHEVRTSVDSSAPPVLTFASRATEFGRDHTRSDGRWTHFVAVPIVLTEPPHRGIPVGSVVMRMHAPRFDDTVITPKTEKSLDVVSQMMINLGTEALSPGPPAARP